MKQPLVSVGVPTYNRPENLLRCLEAIESQSYANLEIIVSDNCSPDDKVDTIIKNFMSTDSRIKHFRQSQNIGAARNFKFVFEQACGDYFLWAADDDQWLGTDLIANLIEYAPHHTLTFPDACHASSPDVSILSDYRICKEQWDYTTTFCWTGAGYPYYGMYNLKKMSEHKITFPFDNDLIYYGEGMFLHNIFLNSLTKFVQDNKIMFTFGGSLPKNKNEQILAFLAYTHRAIDFYRTANISIEKKMSAVYIITQRYGKSIFELAGLLQQDKQNTFIDSTNIVRKKHKYYTEEDVEALMHPLRAALHVLVSQLKK